MPVRNNKIGLTLLALTVASVVRAADTALQPDDLLSLSSARGVQINSDASAVAVSVSMPDVGADTRRSELRLIENQAGRPRTAIVPNARMVTWSRDGKRLLFISVQDGVTTLDAYDRERSETVTLTRLEREPKYLSWNRAETHIAVIADVPAPLQSWFKMPASPATAQRPVLIDHPDFRSDDGSWTPAVESRLYVVEIATGETRELTLPQGTSLSGTEVGDGGAPAWSADGRSVTISVARGRDARANLWNVNRDLLQIDVRTGATSWIAEQPGVEVEPATAPNGRFTAFLRQHGDPSAGVFPFDLVLRDRAGKELLPLAGRDLNISSFRWLPDSKGVVVSYLERGRWTLARVAIDGQLRVLSNDAAGGAAGVASNGVVAFIRSEQGRPPKAVSIDAAGKIVEWTDTNPALANRALGQLGEIDYPSAHVDRRAIHAIVATPRDVKDVGALPVVVDLHGGPYSASTFVFDPDREFFVAQGYVVIQPNYRGSQGYGREFMQLSDRKHYPGFYDEPDAASEMGLDVVGVVQAIRERRLGDPERVFLRGISAGALLTSWTVGRTQQFKAAVAQSWYPGEWSGPAYGSYQIRRYFNGPPWDVRHQPEYWRRQPIMLADRIVTPLLIMQGEIDWITPLMEAEKFYYSLRNLGREVQLAVFPDETHGLRYHPATLRNSLLMEASWFRHHDDGRVSSAP